MFPSLKIDFVLANTADLMKCRLLRFFIMVFTVCQIASISTCLGVSSPQRVKDSLFDLSNTPSCSYYRVPTSSGNHGKPGKSLKKSSMHVKIMEFEKKPRIIMEQSWNNHGMNFVK